MEGIIVGVDESPHARAALRWAVDDAAVRDRSVTAVLAWGFLDQHYAHPGAVFDPTYGSELAAKVLDDLVIAAIGDDHGTVGRVTVNDLPGRALVEMAADAELVVVGARGMGGFKGLLLGSVSRQVLHDASCPVAVVRADPPVSGGPVVVGIDGSAPSRRALAWAVSYARTRALPLIALHSWNLPYVASGFYLAYAAMDRIVSGAGELLRDELDLVDASGLVCPVEQRVAADRPAAALVDVSASASLIVLGSRGHGQLVGTMLGSVSDQVSHHAACPVVVVR